MIQQQPLVSSGYIGLLGECVIGTKAGDRHQWRELKGKLTAAG